MSSTSYGVPTSESPYLWFGEGADVRPRADPCVSMPRRSVRESVGQEARARALRGLLRSAVYVLVFCKGALAARERLPPRASGAELGCSPHDADRARAGGARRRDRGSRAGIVCEPLDVERAGRTILRPPRSRSKAPRRPSRRRRARRAVRVPRSARSSATRVVDMIPPHAFARAHTTAPPRNVVRRRWRSRSCLLESLLECGRFDIDRLRRSLLRWIDDGTWRSTPTSSDYGGATHDRSFGCVVERRLSRAAAPTSTPTEWLADASAPLALWTAAMTKKLVELAHRQSLPTHAHRARRSRARSTA